MYSNQDNLDFSVAMSDVVPLKQDGKISGNQGTGSSLAQQLRRQAIEEEQRQSQNPLSTLIMHSVAPDDFIDYKKPGVQDGVFKQLRLGKYSIESRLNIQKMAPEFAKDKLFEFICDSYKQGLRTILIQHGKGLYAKPEPGIIKSLTNQWLIQLPQVLCFHSALKQHGGLAAVYVLLKKNQQQKLENKERNRKK